MGRRSLDPDQEVLTVEQAADYLQMNKVTLYRYIRDGQLPAARLGKVYRLLRRDVEAFLEARRVQAVHPKTR